MIHNYSEVPNNNTSPACLGAKLIWVDMIYILILTICFLFFGRYVCPGLFFLGHFQCNMDNSYINRLHNKNIDELEFSFFIILCFMAFFSLFYVANL